MSYVNTGDYSYRKLPIYYVQPLELVAIALRMGEKRWDKCVLAARLRHDHYRVLPEQTFTQQDVAAVVNGAEIHVTLRPPEDMKPPEPWCREAGITEKWLHKAKLMVTDA